MSAHELMEFAEDITAQGKKFEKTIMEIAIYSNGSIRLEDLYHMTLDSIKSVEKIISDKIKSENNIKGKEYL